jgi:hypothetical protein
MRVTFDTNTLADVVSPTTSQRPTGAADGATVRAAIESGVVQGFFCEALIILEGIKHADRSTVFGSPEANTHYQHGVAPDGNGVTVINICVAQPARRPLDQRQADRFLAAFGLGMKLLAATRIGMTRVDDPDGSHYVAEPDKGQPGRPSLGSELEKAAQMAKRASTRARDERLVFDRSSRLVVPGPKKIDKCFLIFGKTCYIAILLFDIDALNRVSSSSSTVLTAFSRSRARSFAAHGGGKKKLEPSVARACSRPRRGRLAKRRAARESRAPLRQAQERPATDQRKVAKNGA